jgi:hypothetical protein
LATESQNLSSIFITWFVSTRCLTCKSEFVIHDFMPKLRIIVCHSVSDVKIMKASQQ